MTGAKARSAARDAIVTLVLPAVTCHYTKLDRAVDHVLAWSSQA